ncbi:DinB family protein [Lysinibacillus macroides]|uniref:Damage-inducible protein DinB n=1 Tax=Lysinibacillus macroides TaxID=33935 RepID=A0A0N0UWT8_9BACI|nr:DinB family protein [Lysinibacillus macroides]KOY82304.1 damage-inducible protein DinB [Lysinibacillus macroides]QPR68111.1 DinB family protein [Lysinibacillus macroides]
MTSPVINEKIEVFKKCIEDIISVLKSTDEKKLYVKYSAEEWSAMQVVSHVLEAVEFWVADLEALLIIPGAKWGRNHEHVRRLAAVEESIVAELKVEDAIASLQNLIPKVEAALSKVKEEDLEKTAPSYNPNFDDKPLSFLVDHLIVKHVVGHHGQIIRCLAKVQ